ncbi:hypothetical protein CWI78_02150 [Idiomarina ramblicola]|uniref:Type II toxin-antitoxin system RelE/ParE family toxin n=1 Tax=Idiomarina ramblicola TaxID=263724 RepID=A0A432Z5V4_9GAMM|nr:hypothetical protein CWI78_02150 [Idiomarina ramblicola]
MTTPSNRNYVVVASPVFRLSLQRFKAFLTRKHSQSVALNTVMTIKSRIQERLPVNPEIAPISERLFDLGLTDYRQWLIDEHNLIIYKVNQSDSRVELLLVMDSRQSTRKLLFEMNLLV